MKVSADTKRTINSDCRISAAEGTFDLKMFKSSKKVQMFDSTKSSTGIEDAFKKEGFFQKTDYFEIRALKKPAVSSLKEFKESSESPAIAEINVDVGDDESAIAVEINPATGEVLDWYVAESEMNVIQESGNVLLHSYAQTSKKLKRCVIINIPVDTHYSDEKDVYSPTSMGFINPKKVLKKVIKVFSFKKLKKKAKKVIAKVLAAPARLLDKAIVKSEMLGKLKADGKISKLSSTNIKNMRGKRVLLFVHGIISNSEKAFGDLLQDQESYEALKDRYEGNILACNHWTLTKDVFENARFIAAQLPRDITLDIVCHSRGATVVRSLIESNQTRKKLKTKSINVDKVVFVAGACEGSDLATGNALDNLFRVFTKMGSLLGKPTLQSIVIAKAIKLILSGLQTLPGTESVNPNGKYIKALSKSHSTLANTYFYFRANFDPDNRAIAFIDQKIIDEAIFSSKANDVVVPFEGAGVTKNYLNGKVNKKLVRQYGSKNKPKNEIWHTNFFENPSMRRDLILTLN